ncbi:E3 ubiquitin-protein ligase RNF4 isoform X2 [Harpegnathos saltator]|uniref:E3 ubiquitin-protein ligase RNF4 isoform X2 n=1 Tax=Harpegnathos saltator TaxID=610380 RepID=UPI000948C267|nr:E3 ubiquitin-protein ligase RNF4 isoform X2 [Harpegnathos saltator]
MDKRELQMIIMDDNQENNITNGSLFSPVDIIDLTHESSIGIAQSHDRHLANVEEIGNNTVIDLNLTSTHKTSASCSNRRKPKLNNIKNMEEIITLDDTICIPDDDKYYVVGSDNGESVRLICPICFELLSSKLKPTTTRCGHIFCAQCLETHFCTSKKCPTCQSTITLKSCTRLFL